MREFMQQALDLAKQGRGMTSPNPAVGAVVVRDGKVIGTGFHTWKGVDHAEIIALRQAGDAARGATLYVSLEPCSHQGRTGPCADAVIQAGVARVVVAMQDPNPDVSGRGIQRLRDAGADVAIDQDASAAAEKLNEPFVHFMRTGKPLVTVKAALTLDGKIAAPQDNLGWITSETARADVQLVRHDSDAILTGLGTLLEDDCLLTDRSGRERARPLLRIVLDSQLRTPLTSKMVTTANNDVMIVCTSAASHARREALEKAGVRILIADGPMGRTDPSKLLDYLAKERYLSLMVEAGSKVNWTMLDGGFADKVLFYYAPKILGGMESLPVAGGTGRQRRVDALLLERVTVHPIATGRVCRRGILEEELMFTGIIEELGHVGRFEAGETGARLCITCSAVLKDAQIGSSIAVNGTCLTAVELSENGFWADLAPETLQRSNLGALETGSLVNLERPLRANARLDGHFVLGHVDATAEIVALNELGDGNWWLTIQVPQALSRYIVEKGSLAVDGISLTVAEIEDGNVSFTIIPHTYGNTSLQSYGPGSRVNLEVDILAKHLEKLVASLPALKTAC